MDKGLPIFLGVLIIIGLILIIRFYVFLKDEYSPHGERDDTSLIIGWAFIVTGIVGLITFGSVFWW